MFTAVYTLCTVVLIFFEGVAIGRPARGDTISEHIWGLRATVLVLALAPVWFWMTGHFWNPNEPDGVLWNDLAYLAVGLVVGVYNHWHLRRRGR